MFAHGGTSNVAGTIEAKDGFVETSADTVKIDDNFKVTADTWLIDPKDFTVASSGGDMTGATLSNNLATASIEIESVNGATDGNGDIFVNDTISWSSDKKLTLNAENDIYINSSITASNTAGQLSLVYGQGAVASENTANYYVNAPINLKAGDNFFTTLGSDGSEVTWTVITSLGSEGSTTGTDLQGMNGGLTGNYVLGSNIDASDTSSWNDGAGFDPIGEFGGDEFKGNFDGLGHIVSNLTINRPSEDNIGLFGYVYTETISKTISNIGIVDNSFIGKNNVGGLIGMSLGSYNEDSSIEYSYIKNSYSTGNVSGENNVGGLVGRGENTLLKNSYALGNVSGESYVGGLVGYYSNSDITNAYSTGEVKGDNKVGGLAGYANSYSNITNSFWDIDTSKQTTSDGGIGIYSSTENSINAFTEATYTNWDFDNTWFIIDGETRPMLRSEYSTTITNAHQLQLMAIDLTADYTLANDIDLSATKDNASDIWNIAKGFDPIGDGTTGFTGNLDGLGHTISDLTVNRASEDKVGLFGEISGGSISNIGLVDNSIIGNDHTGGVVGKVGVNSTIINSYSTGAVSGNNYIGGLSGSNFEYSSKIINSYSTGAVNGNNHIGGFVGLNYGTIANSYSTGAVSSSATNPYLNGFVGSRQAGTITNSFWDIETSGITVDDNIDGTTGITTLQFADASTFSSWSSDIWSFGSNDVEGYALALKPYLKDVTADAHKKLSSTTLFNSGFGTEANPYTITNWTQLQNIGNSAVVSDGYHYDLSNSINNETLDYTDIVGDVADSNNLGFEPIAEYLGAYSKNAFMGTFDGLGHTISNLYINRDGEDYVGLFGKISASTISNIGLLNNSILGEDNVGALVGYATNSSSILNSYSTGDVSGDSQTGGLIGENRSGTVLDTYATGDVIGDDNVGGLIGRSQDGNLTIKNSYATGNVSGGDKVGGFIGESTDTIENSYATGNVSGEDEVGGLVGFNRGTIKNSYSKSNVNATGNYAEVGGLAGYNSEIILNSYAIGNVTSSGNNADVGGLVGETRYSTITNSYSTGEVSSTGDNDQIGGLIGNNNTSNNSINIITNSYFNKTLTIGMPDEETYGKTTAQMQLASTYNDAPSSTWNVVEDSTLSSDYLYPRLVNTDGEISWKIYKFISTSNNTESNDNNNNINIEDIIRTITNTTAIRLNPPKIKVPETKNTQTSVNLFTKPTTGESVKKVTRTEVKSMQNSDDTVVPLGNGSQVSIINDGVNLPLGLEQEFYVSANEEGTN